MRGLMMDVQLAVPAMVRRAETLFGSVRVASRGPDGAISRTTYGDIAARARRLAAALGRLGVGRGDRVATLAWNHARHLEAYCAVPSMGAVLHTLNLRLHPDELAYIATHAGDRVVLVDDILVPLLQQFLERTPIEHVVVMGAAEARPDGWFDYERFLDEGGNGVEAVQVGENDAACMCYSSGTTGRPKGAVYSHRALALQAMQWTSADVAGLGQRDVVLGVVPMFHINGWCLPFAALNAGAPLVLPGPDLSPAGLLSLIGSERVTLSAGVPTVWLGVQQMLEREPGTHDVTSLRTLVIGGSAVPAGLIRAYERIDVKIVQAWGMTETTSLATIGSLPAGADALPAEQRHAMLARQGRPMAFTEIRARAPQGLVPWDGATPGELEVRGPAVASAYYEGGPAVADAFTDDGWFRTGDIVTIDAQGSIAICDRAKDLIKSGGEWISSVALENALMDHAAVAEAAVVAVPHPRWDERPLAVVVLKPGASATPDELRAHLAPGVPRWWLPDAFEFVDAIPRTSTGKFLKSALRARFGTPS